ncbi:MAG: hypothetical protein GF308_16580 [Candidatus Heimdallarchaeota archaeon]|nr:hypothetical protein [Candidatus Heimdallarchaeota archaeon]
MKAGNYKLICIMALLLIPIMVTPVGSKATVEPTNTTIEQKDLNGTKIGFSWVNGLVGASELTEVGYERANELDADLEHRDFNWFEIEGNWPLLQEWDYYLNQHELEKSAALAVINSNFTTAPIDIDFQNNFEDEILLGRLKNFTDYLLVEVEDLDYISFGSEINAFFERWVDTATKTVTNSTVLDSYVALCEEMYTYIHNHESVKPDIQVLTIFRIQRPIDLVTTEAIIDRFTNCSDIFGTSTRIFTNNFGSMVQLTEDEVMAKFQEFADLCGTKKMAITNTYAVSDNRAGSYEGYQANYLKACFKTIDALGDQLEFFCWYSMHDYPPGYLGMLFHPYLEVHSTAGLLTYNGDPKLSYYAWVEEMQARGRMENYQKPWEIAIAAIALALVVGFIIFAYVMEGIEFVKEREEKPEEPEELVFGFTEKDRIKKGKKEESKEQKDEKKD